jgi:predicted Zn-dependent protease
VEYALKVGYDPREMANFFKTLDKMQGGSESGGLPDWFSTHPNPADRVVDVQKKAQEWIDKTGSKNLEINRASYLNRINGMVYGDNPRQGFVENNTFYHPDLKFMFPVPAGWKLTNLPTQVQILSADEKAAILFSIPGGETVAAAYADFIKNTKAQVIEEKDISVHGLSAKRSLVQLAGQSGPLRVLSYFIMKDKNVYVFHGFTTDQFFKDYAAEFENTMAGFKQLTDRSKLGVQPERLRIQKVGSEMTLEQALKQFKVPEERLKEMSLVNGLELNTRVSANTLLKTVSK